MINKIHMIILFIDVNLRSNHVNLIRHLRKISSEISLTPEEVILIMVNSGQFYYHPKFCSYSRLLKLICASGMGKYSSRFFLKTEAAR